MQKPLRRSLATLIALALGAAAPISAARAADYPTRPVTVVVPYAPGGQTDAFARIMAEALRESLGQPVIVDNKPGAGTMIGSEYVARAAPDGYTILVATPGVVVAPSLYNSTKYDVVKDFQPITLACSILMVLSVNPNKMPVKDVGGFISALKANPDKYFYGTAGAGSSPHLIGEWFKKLTGTQMTHVAFKGSAPAVTALLSGQIDLMFDAYASQAELAKSGGIKILAVTSDQRSDLIPDVPTLKESGVTDLVVLPWTDVIDGLSDPDAAALMGRIEVSILAEYDALYPAKRVSDVSIETDSGELFNSDPVTADGDAGDPGWEDIVAAKFRAHVGLEPDDLDAPLCDRPLGRLPRDELIAAICRASGPIRCGTRSGH